MDSVFCSDDDIAEYVLVAESAESVFVQVRRNIEVPGTLQNFTAQYVGGLFTRSPEGKGSISFQSHVW